MQQRDHKRLNLGQRRGLAHHQGGIPLVQGVLLDLVLVHFQVDYQQEEVRQDLHQEEPVVCFIMLMLHAPARETALRSRRSERTSPNV